MATEGGCMGWEFRSQSMRVHLEDGNGNWQPFPFTCARVP